MEATLSSKGTVHTSVGSFKVTTSTRYTYEGGRAWAKGKVYVTAPEPEELGLGSAPASFHGDDGGLNDQAWKSFNALEVKVQRMFAEHAVAGKLSFSRKAGCGCGCSPGFTSDVPSLRGQSVWVTVKPV